LSDRAAGRKSSPPTLAWDAGSLAARDHSARQHDVDNRVDTGETIEIEDG
jgi:hypothetical protein